MVILLFARYVYITFITLRVSNQHNIEDRPTTDDRRPISHPEKFQMATSQQLIIHQIYTSGSWVFLGGRSANKIALLGFV